MRIVPVKKDFYKSAIKPIFGSLYRMGQVYLQDLADTVMFYPYFEKKRLEDDLAKAPYLSETDEKAIDLVAEEHMLGDSLQEFFDLYDNDKMLIQRRNKNSIIFNRISSLGRDFIHSMRPEFTVPATFLLPATFANPLTVMLPFFFFIMSLAARKSIMLFYCECKKPQLITKARKTHGRRAMQKLLKSPSKS